MKYGILFRWRSFWVGVHYSQRNRRFCINPIPFVTIWITLLGGVTPGEKREVAFQSRVGALIEKFDQYEEGYRP